MIKVPDFIAKEIFLTLGASAEEVDRLVHIYQTRHLKPIALELRIEYFNFLGLRDSWERIIHLIREDDVLSIINFIARQSPQSLIYKRCLEKLCHFIFTPDWVEKISTMWHRHSLHTHNPKETWEQALRHAHAIDSSGLLAENLINQVFRMKDHTQLVLQIRKDYATRPKFCSPEAWRPLTLEERYLLPEQPQQALQGWLSDREAAKAETLRRAELEEFKKFVTHMQSAITRPEEVLALLETINSYEKIQQRALPETKTRVRRFFFNKLLEPYKNMQYDSDN